MPDDYQSRNNIVNIQNAEDIKQRNSDNTEDMKHPL